MFKREFTQKITNVEVIHELPLPKKRDFRLKSIYVLSLFSISIAVINTTPVFAHSLKIDGDVGGTLHIEPNDTARAGEPAQTWFALTRKGGQVIPLQDCNCRLQVYTEPYTPENTPLIEPNLQPVQAERYQGIPGTEITFPKPGRYRLKLTGEPKTAGSFSPFELEFPVTVAAGKAVDIIPRPVETQLQTQLPESATTTPQFIQPIPVILILLVVLGIGFFVFKKKS